MQSDKIFVHNRIGLLASMNFGHSVKTTDGTQQQEVTTDRLPSPVTDSEEDKGYKSWEVARRISSGSGTSPPFAKEEVFMPPPGTPTVLKRAPRGAVVLTPASKMCRGKLVTSTPNVNIITKKLAAGKNTHPVDESLNWESEEDEGRFSQQSYRTDSPDHELCECQSQMKFSFAINCEEGNSIARSTSSAGADVESVSSEHDLPFDEDEKVLSGDRLSQMTRTYHDIEAVTHLLEEKERDLELAARIGQTLLQKNKEVAQRNELLEEQLAGAIEEVSQLRHEISLKEDLLHTYADDDTDSSGAPSPVKELRNFGRSGMYNHIENLQVRIKKLEEENSDLKLDRFKYQTENEVLESQEQQLVSDAIKELEVLREELKDARENNRMLSEELSLRNDEAVRQQEEITRLLTQIVDMQRKQKQVALENEELQQHLTAANNTQYELTREIQALDDRYQEVANMLDETREEARLLRDCPEQYGRSVPFSDSLAAELECSGGLSAEMYLQDANPLSFAATPINWSSPPSSVVDGDVEEELGLHARAKDVINHITRSEPRVQSTGTHSERVLNTARFVNNIKNYSMNSRFQYATPRKQDRPIPTPLSIPGSNRSPLFIHASPDSTPSSGRCMSSTPHHDKRKPLNLSLFGHSFAMSPKDSSQNQMPKYASLRLQLANKTLAKTLASKPSETPKPVNINPQPSKHSVSRHNRSTSALMSKNEEVDGKRAERSWHGETFDGFAREKGFATPSLGRPGVPGTEDLERAIRKLTLRRENARYMEMEKRLAMNDESFDALCNSGTVTPSSMPSGGRTPPPSGPSSPKPMRRHRFTPRSSIAPKLRIVKPLEGSVTLNQWKYLAERDRTLPALQKKSDMPSGIITRDRVAEALSRSREGSLNNTSITTDVMTTSHVTPIKSSGSTSKISDSPLNSSLHPPQAASSPPPVSTADVGVQFSESEASRKGVLQISPICPGKNYGLTSTRYTFTNSRVMNPTDDTRAKPSCASMVQSTVYCNTQTSTRSVTMASCHTSVKTKDSLAYLSTVHPFLAHQPKPADKAKQTKLAEKFFKDSTRTCSMQLGLARLFQEHSVKGLPREEIVEKADATEGTFSNDGDLDSPPLISSGEQSAFTANKTRTHSSQSHIVWNRSLQRTFLLPSVLPSRNIMFNLNRRSESKKPDTPPNSPITSMPSSSSFLLNEILAETPQTQPEEPKQEIESLFSSNLLSKLAKIGRLGFQGLQGRTSSRPPPVTTSVSAAPKYTSTRNTSSTVTTLRPPRGLISRCATAPGSLRSKDDTDVEPAESRRPLTTPSVDWTELHGSSGALNLPVDSKNYNDAKITDGYLNEDSSSSSDEGGARCKSKPTPRESLKLHLDKSGESITNNKAKPSTRPKTRTGTKKK